MNPRLFTTEVSGSKLKFDKSFVTVFDELIKALKVSSVKALMQRVVSFEAGN